MRRNAHLFQLDDQYLKWSQNEPFQEQGESSPCSAGEEQERMPVAEVEDESLLLIDKVEDDEAGLPRAPVVAQEG